MGNEDVEILAIGTELVSGLILDTNSHWLAEEVSLLGGRVRRITALADDLDAIVGEFDSAIERRAGLVITSGGLGPTPDDLTVAAVAAAAGCEPHTPPQVLEDYARRRGMTLAEVSSPPRVKMGAIPSAATLFLNPVGWAPCFSIDLRDTTIWSLPGPPKEMKACFTTHLKPGLECGFAGRSARLRVYIDSFESETSPFMQAVMRRLPTAYLKAYVGLSGSDGLPVDIVVHSSDGEDPRAILQQAYDLFSGAAAAAGKTVTLEPPARE